MRILLTGSSGQLGTEIARQLSADHEIIGLDRLAGKWTSQVASITDRKSISALMPGSEAVIHTACCMPAISTRLPNKTLSIPTLAAR